jgi:hypothetical protein
MSVTSRCRRVEHQQRALLRTTLLPSLSIRHQRQLQSIGKALLPSDIACRPLTYRELAVMHERVLIWTAIVRLHQNDSRRTAVALRACLSGLSGMAARAVGKGLTTDNRLPRGEIMVERQAARAFLPEKTLRLHRSSASQLAYPSCRLLRLRHLGDQGLRDDFVR